MSIEEIKSRLDAATPGPWEEFWQGHIRSIPTAMGVCQTFGPEDRKHPNAEFIAHAPEDMRRLLNAVEAVLGLHKVERRWMTHEGADESYDSEAEAREWMDGDEPEGELPFFEVCAECKRVEEGPCDGECTRELGYRESMWPCPTVKAVTSALDPS